MRYLLDTDVCVELLRRRQPAPAARFARIPAGEAALSVVTVLELTFGALKSARPEQNLAAVRALADGLPVLALEAAVADAYGRVRLELEKAGARIGANDLLIAAQALHQGVTLVTNNQREFSRVPGLRVENWLR